MGERQERGFVCAAGTVPRHERGTSRFQSAGDVVEGEWRAPAEGLHIQNDFRCSGAGGLCQRVHDPSTGRRGGAWNRRPGGVAAAGGGLPMKVLSRRQKRQVLTACGKVSWRSVVRL